MHVDAEWFERPDLKIKSRLFSSGLDSSYVANVGAERSPSLAETAFLYRLASLAMNATAPTMSTSQNATRLIPMMPLARPPMLNARTVRDEPSCSQLRKPQARASHRTNGSFGILGKNECPCFLYKQHSVRHFSAANAPFIFSYFRDASLYTVKQIERLLARFAHGQGEQLGRR